MFDEFNINFGDRGRFVPEDVRNLFLNNGKVTLVNFRQQAECKHVLAVLGIVDKL